MLLHRMIEVVSCSLLALTLRNCMVLVTKLYFLKAQFSLIVLKEPLNLKQLHNYRINSEKVRSFSYI